MSKRSKKPRPTKSRSNPQRRRRNVKHAPTTYILETGTLAEMKGAKKRTERFLKYHWDFNTELLQQRRQIEDELKQTLNENCLHDFEFQGWQRAVKYKYSLHPLSTIGSLFDPGGRFNIGDVNPAAFPQFPALYIAMDKKTAFAEALGQDKDEDSELSAFDFALCKPQSETIVSVSGNLEQVFDLRSSSYLRKFTNLIKGFRFSENIYKQANALGIDPPEIIKTPGQLQKSLLDENWRSEPMLYDIPANSQFFGHLIYLSSIEGIIYPSKMTGADCLAIFPRNFRNTSSFIQMDDEPPNDTVPTRIDADTWRLCEMSFEELSRD